MNLIDELVAYMLPTRGERDTLGAQVRELRTRHFGESQVDFARRLHVAASVVSRLEADIPVRPETLERLRDVAEEVGVCLDWQEAA